MYHQYFEHQLLALQKEIQYHPDLQLILNKQEDKDIYILIAEISAFCGIVMDGDYTKDDMLKVCAICTQKLYERRVGILLPPPAIQ